MASRRHAFIEIRRPVPRSTKKSVRGILPTDRLYDQTKSRPKAAVSSRSTVVVLLDLGQVRTGDYHGLSSFHDVSGLGIIGAGTGGNAERGHRNTGHERDDHNLQVGRLIRRMNGVVHLSLPADYAASLGKEVLPLCFRMVSRFRQNGFIRSAFPPDLPDFGVGSTRHRPPNTVHELKRLVGCHVGSHHAPPPPVDERNAVCRG